jgi:hypothetical protein
VVGSGVGYLPEGSTTRVLGESLPDARDARLLPGAMRMLPPRPIYGRAPDAKPMAAA